MSVEDSGVIDAVGRDPSTGDIVLTIADHRSWGDNEHLFLLQEKINTYLVFVESGQIGDIFEDVDEHAVIIKVVCKSAPDQDGLSFLDKVNEIVSSAGIGFSWEHLRDQ